MNRYLSGVVRRPLIDQIEVYAPNLVALINRMALQLPAPLRPASPRWRSPLAGSYLWSGDVLGR